MTFQEQFEERYQELAKLGLPEIPDFATQENFERYILMYQTAKMVNVAKNYQQWCKPGHSTDGLSQVLRLKMDGQYAFYGEGLASEEDGGICCGMHQKYVWTRLPIRF